jgi:uncharacterized protein (DUF1330 family)
MTARVPPGPNSRAGPPPEPPAQPEIQEESMIIEFPTMAKAQGWYESAAYQEILPIRLKANRDKMVIVPGVV